MWGIFLAGLVLLTSTPLCVNNLRQSNYDNVIAGIDYKFINNCVVNKESDPYIDKKLLKLNLVYYLNNNLSNFNKKFTLKLTYYDSDKKITFNETPKGTSIFITSELYFYKYEKGITYFIQKDGWEN